MARLTQRIGLTRYEADEFYKKALAAYQKHKIEDALIHMTEAITALPGNAEYYAARGLIYLEDGIEDKAEADFASALSLYAYEMLAHYGRGVIAFNNRRWEEALRHFTAAYNVDPQRAETLYYLALVYHRLDRNDAALHMMQRAYDAFDPQDPINGKTNEQRRNYAVKWMNAFKKLLTP